MWDNVCFPHSHLVRQWFAAHDRMLVEYLPTYSPFLNPIEKIFSAWRWKVYDRHLHVQMALLAAMDAACDNITAESCRGWIRHSRQYFSRCIARDICCDVDENIWPDRQERLDVPEWFTYVQLQYVLLYCYLVPWRELTRYCNDPLLVCVYVCVSVPDPVHPHGGPGCHHWLCLFTFVHSCTKRVLLMFVLNKWL